MKVKEYVIIKIKKIPDGVVFTYEDVIQNASTKEAVIKNLNRLVASGYLSKLSKGRFYKPKVTPFGNLKPSEYQIAKDLLEKKGKIIGYLTGLAIYNKLALTTQIGNIIQVGRKDIKSTIQRGNFKISFIKQKNEITKRNIPLLQILDSIRYFKEIPDSKPVFLCKRFLSLISNLSPKDKTLLVCLTLNYSPATRALIGALLDELGYNELSKTLLSSLNPISSYKFGISKDSLSTIENWSKTDFLSSAILASVTFVEKAEIPLYTT